LFDFILVYFDLENLICLIFDLLFGVFEAPVIGKVIKEFGGGIDTSDGLQLLLSCCL